jgi:hypothetical protein
MRLNAMKLTILSSLLLLWNQFKWNSDRSLPPLRKHLHQVKVNLYSCIRPLRSLSQRNLRKIAVSVVNRDINQWIPGTNLRTHTRNLVLNCQKKPSLTLQSHQLPVLIVISQDTLTNNATRNATRQPRKMKSLMLCYLVLITLPYPKD